MDIPSDDVAARFDSTGLPLGCVPDCCLEPAAPVQFPLGGTLVLVTDGLLEARNSTDELFGADRLLDVVRVNHHKSAAEIVGRLQAAVKAFCSDKPVEDDITIVIVRRPEAAAA